MLHLRDAQDMTKESVKNQKPALNYDRVVLANLRRSRRGKHHDLLQGVFEDLQTLPTGSAIKIPLSELDGSLWRIYDLLSIAPQLHEAWALRLCRTKTTSISGRPSVRSNDGFAVHRR